MCWCVAEFLQGSNTHQVRRILVPGIRSKVGLGAKERFEQLRTEKMFVERQLEMRHPTKDDVLHCKEWN